MLAAGYPEDGDLWLARQARLDESGFFMTDYKQLPELLPNGILVRWDEVEYLQFLPTQISGPLESPAGSEP